MLPASDAEADEAARAEILLSLTPDVGPLLRKRLLDRFGDAENVLAASEAELQQVAGIGPKTSRQIVNARCEVPLDAYLNLAREHDLAILTPSAAAYPRMLQEIPDPPGVLFVRGRIEPTDQLAVAIVGTRRASQYGRRQAERLAAGLARIGIAVV
ncbi:MAG: DNA-processing protein DprA, partial [Planctomycetota bacterium]